jgi:PPOX class probable F420-dependent enzyme
MSERIPENVLDLFQKPALAHLATIMPDGTPQVTPVWVDYDGTHVLVNTAKGRQKALNMQKQPKVGLDIVDPANPFHSLAVRGRVVEITENGADAHIDKLAKKYIGQDKYPYRQPGEVRVLVKIEPDRVRAS